MSNNENKQNSEDLIGCLSALIILVLIVIFSNSTELKFIDFSFEKKDYIPISIQDNLFLINKRNGKTYIFDAKNERYLYLTKPSKNLPKGL